MDAQLKRREWKFVCHITVMLFVLFRDCAGNIVQYLLLSFWTVPFSFIYFFFMVYFVPSCFICLLVTDCLFVRLLVVVWFVCFFVRLFVCLFVCCAVEPTEPTELSEHTEISRQTPQLYLSIFFFLLFLSPLNTIFIVGYSTGKGRSVNILCLQVVLRVGKQTGGTVLQRYFASRCVLLPQRSFWRTSRSTIFSFRVEKAKEAISFLSNERWTARREGRWEAFSGDPFRRVLLSSPLLSGPSPRQRSTASILRRTRFRRRSSKQKKRSAKAE